MSALLHARRRSSTALSDAHASTGMKVSSHATVIRCLNEVADEYPSAVSLAAGRSTDQFSISRSVLYAELGNSPPQLI
jgi:hypothetical protein